MMPTLKFVDLFAGMGGTRIGFEQAAKELGFDTECVLTSEIKPSAIQALITNFNEKNMQGDIRAIDAESIPDFDILILLEKYYHFVFFCRYNGIYDARNGLCRYGYYKRFL